MFSLIFGLKCANFLACDHTRNERIKPWFLVVFGQLHEEAHIWNDRAIL